MPHPVLGLSFSPGDVVDSSTLTTVCSVADPAVCTSQREVSVSISIKSIVIPHGHTINAFTRFLDSDLTFMPAALLKCNKSSVLLDTLFYSERDLPCILLERTTGITSFDFDVTENGKGDSYVSEVHTGNIFLIILSAKIDIPNKYTAARNFEDVVRSLCNGERINVMPFEQDDIRMTIIRDWTETILSNERVTSDNLQVLRKDVTSVVTRVALQNFSYCGNCSFRLCSDALEILRMLAKIRRWRELSSPKRARYSLEEVKTRVGSSEYFELETLTSAVVIAEKAVSDVRSFLSGSGKTLIEEVKTVKDVLHIIVPKLSRLTIVADKLRPIFQDTADIDAVHRNPVLVIGGSDCTSELLGLKILEKMPWVVCAMAPEALAIRVFNEYRCFGFVDVCPFEKAGSVGSTKFKHVCRTHGHLRIWICSECKEFITHNNGSTDILNCKCGKSYSSALQFKCCHPDHKDFNFDPTLIHSFKNAEEIDEAISSQYVVVLNDATVGVKTFGSFIPRNMPWIQCSNGPESVALRTSKKWIGFGFIDTCTKRSKSGKLKNADKAWAKRCPGNHDELLRRWICRKCEKTVECSFSDEHLRCACGLIDVTKCTFQCWHPDHKDLPKPPSPNENQRSCVTSVDIEPMDVVQNPNAINILMLGPSGSGKTTLINSILMYTNTADFDHALNCSEQPLLPLNFGFVNASGSVSDFPSDQTQAKRVVREFDISHNSREFNFIYTPGGCDFQTAITTIKDISHVHAVVFVISAFKFFGQGWFKSLFQMIPRKLIESSYIVITGCDGTHAVNPNMLPLARTLKSYGLIDLWNNRTISIDNSGVLMLLGSRQGNFNVPDSVKQTWSHSRNTILRLLIDLSAQQFSSMENILFLFKFRKWVDDFTDIGRFPEAKVVGSYLRRHFVTCPKWVDTKADMASVTEHDLIEAIIKLSKKPGAPRYTKQLFNLPNGFLSQIMDTMKSFWS